MLERRAYRVLLTSLLALIWLTSCEKMVLVQNREESLRIALEGSEEAKITDFPFTVALYLVKQNVMRQEDTCKQDEDFPLLAQESCVTKSNEINFPLYLIHSKLEPKFVRHNKLIPTFTSLQKIKWDMTSHPCWAYLYFDLDVHSFLYVPSNVYIEQSYHNCHTSCHIFLYGKQDRKSPICTASIMHKNWVLTASHCVDNPGEPKFYVVKAGHDKLVQLDDDTIVQTRPALQIVKHPKYRQNSVSKYDVALIKVMDFEFNDRVNRILPYAMDWSLLPKASGKEYRSDACKAVGWGSIELKVPSDGLRYSNITVQHGTHACRCFQMYMQRRLLCSDARELSGICPGDSGGPLICNGSVAGVAHVIYHKDSCDWTYFGKLKLKCNSPKVISAWMFVCPMLDFISEHVPDTPKKPASCLSPPKLVLSAVIAVLSIASCYWSNRTIWLNY